MLIGARDATLDDPASSRKGKRACESWQELFEDLGAIQSYIEVKFKFVFSTAFMMLSLKNRREPFMSSCLVA